MKQFARKTRNLSIVPPATELANLPSEMSSLTLRESFRGWLESVNPTILWTRHVEHKPTQSHRQPRPLTSTDLVRVNHATVRESNAHRAWPPEVVAKFLAAEVIRRPRK